MEYNEMVQNGLEQNEIEWNRTEQNRFYSNPDSQRSYTYTNETNKQNFSNIISLTRNT